MDRSAKSQCMVKLHNDTVTVRFEINLTAVDEYIDNETPQIIHK